MASSKWCVLTEERLISNHFSYAYELLQEKCEIIMFKTFLQHPERYENKIDAVYGVLHRRLDEHGIKLEDFLNRIPKVRVVISPGKGTDHLHLPLIWEKGIRVANTGNANASTTAELGFTIMMACARNIKVAMNALLSGLDLKTFQQYGGTHGGTSLEGSTLGIVGMGDIGYKVAERAVAFGMNNLYHNRSQRSKEDEEIVKATYCETLEKLLAQSDFVMLCVPLTKETKCLIGAKELKLMKSTAVLVNISRGDTVDTEALVKALQEKTIKGAALDVTSPEPLPKDHPLLHMPNVIVTPHFAGATKESVKEVSRICVENLLAALESTVMTHELKPPQH